MNGSEFPLLLLHGALGYRRQFEPLMQTLNNTKIYAPDLCGHGENASRETRFNLQVFADDVIAFLDQNGIRKANVFGHSMGGYIGLYLCLQHPGRIAKVFTLGTKISWSKKAATREAGMLDAEKLEAKVPAFVEELKKRHAGADWKQLLEKTRKMMFELGETDPLNAKSLAEITHKVRLGIGDRDTTAVVEDTVAAYRCLQNGQLEIFPSTPHPFERVSLVKLKSSMEEFFRD
jgi:pimeloyl-ACP methyl ester carboxylesterase